MQIFVKYENIVDINQKPVEYRRMPTTTKKAQFPHFAQISYRTALKRFFFAKTLPHGKFQTFPHTYTTISVLLKKGAVS